MYKEWTTPAGTLYRLYEDMNAQNHILIAGATGSGKSVTINGLITTMLYQSPAKVRMVLIDPKKCELIEYADLPHVIAYASEPREMLAALNGSLQIIEDRFKDMQRRRLREYDGSDVYVIIDELADLMTTASIKRQAAQTLQRIAQIGRAAHVHVIAATQCPLAKIIPTEIKCNFDARLALRTATRQDSRNIVDVAGAEQLPDPRAAGEALGYYRHGADLELYKLPRYDEQVRRGLISYWIKNRRPRVSLFGRRSA